MKTLLLIGLVVEVLMLSACSTAGGMSMDGPGENQSPEATAKLPNYRELLRRPLNPAPVADDEFQDPNTGLIWKRCAQGLKWENGVCAGKMLVGPWMMMGGNYAQRVAHTEGKHWRIPTVSELRQVAYANPPYKMDQYMPVFGVWSADVVSGTFGYKSYAAHIYNTGSRISESDGQQRRGIWLVRSK